MTVWRYRAVPVGGKGRGGMQRGELSGGAAAEVREALRRIGLQVIDLRPLRRRAWGGGRESWSKTQSAFRAWMYRYLCHRRRDERAELYDGLATLLASGVPLMEAVQTLAASAHRRRSPLRAMLVDVAEYLRCGASLDIAMTAHPGWFDGCEIAMVISSQYSGKLPEVLRGLAERHERSGELGRKLTGALAYPGVVAAVGIGVVVFLSVKTLPDLVGVLADAGIEAPALTRGVMSFGGFLAGSWPLILLALLLAAGGGLALFTLAAAGRIEPPPWLRHCSPRLIRRMAVARLSWQLSELLRTGVPMVEALRVTAPTVRAWTLRRRLETAAGRVEHGEDLAAALDDEHWFDAQFRRLLEIGQASGELHELLRRIGDRYARQADRLIVRLAALLEPAVILVLAVLVGLVVMAAVLPLLRLQEVL